MLIIDRYLLRQFLRVFLICFCSLTGLFAVFDAFNSLDEFLIHSEKHGNLLQTMAEYYGYRSVALFDRLSGVLAMTAAMFTITWFQRFNELTALGAAGLPPVRIVRPIILASVVISLAAATSRELLIPRIRTELGRNAKDLAGDQGQELRPRYDNETDILIRGKQTFANEQRVTQPDFVLPPALEAYGRRLSAAEAYFRPKNDEHPAGYLLTSVLQPKNLSQKPSLPVGKDPVIVTPHGNPWLQADECFVACDVDFEQLTGGQNWRYFSSTIDLIRGLQNRSLDFGADVRVSIHSRFVRPLVDICLLFLGLPLVLTRESRNVFFSIGLCLCTVSGFMLVVFGAAYLGAAYLISPALAAWIPLLIFVPVAVAISEPLLV